MMNWRVKKIQEDDYGCEERPENEKAKVLVTLADENGQECILRVEDDWLYQHGIDEGDLFPYDSGKKMPSTASSPSACRSMSFPAPDRFLALVDVGYLGRVSVNTLPLQDRIDKL